MADNQRVCIEGTAHEHEACRAGPCGEAGDERRADIGPDCCGAIDIITRNCWPTMLTSLGFTAEEGNILRGYCDAYTPSPAAPPPAAESPVQPPSI
ncbi:Egg cell-secreted protein 1.4 [Vitis vinifera]|uniref:Egg cell-secreted protein 1.4 n=1 Tax=Vitis vinifera TaxID=29760 RepID=A0A438KJL9_VITVI|nr:Egg cell-secreted protein 1.4 [Vitis vinifera]